MASPSSRGPSATPEDRFVASLLNILTILARTRNRIPAEIPQDDIDALHGLLSDPRIPEPTDSLEFRIPTNLAPGDAVVLWRGYRPGAKIPDRKTLSELAVPAGSWPHAVEALRRGRQADRAAIAIATAALQALTPDGIRTIAMAKTSWAETARTIIAGLRLAKNRMEATKWHQRRAAVIDAVGQQGIEDPLRWVVQAERRAGPLKKVPSGEWPATELPGRSRGAA